MRAAARPGTCLAEKNAEDEKGFHSSLFLPIPASIRVETSGQKLTAETAEERRGQNETMRR